MAIIALGSETTAVTDIFVATDGSHLSNGSQISHPTTVKKAVAMINRPSGFGFNPEGLNLFVRFADGLYDVDESLTIYNSYERRFMVTFLGNLLNTSGVQFTGQGLNGSAVFRVFRSNVVFENFAIRNDQGDGIAAFYNGTNVFARNIAFGTIENDCFFADEGAAIHYLGLSYFLENSNPDTFFRAREGGSILLTSNPSVNAQNFTWDFADSFADAISGYIRGDFLTFSNAGNVTGDQWDTAYGGEVTIGFNTYTDLDLPGSFTFRDRNQDAHINKRSLTRLNINGTVTLTSRFLQASYYYLPSSNSTIKLDFAIPNRGWNVLFYNRNPLYSITITDQNDAVIAKIGGGDSPWVRIVSDSAIYRPEQGVTNSGHGFDYTAVDDNSVNGGELEYRDDLDTIFISTSDVEGLLFNPIASVLMPGSTITISSKLDPTVFSVNEVLEYPVLNNTLYAIKIRRLVGIAVLGVNNTPVKVYVNPCHKFGGIEVLRGDEVSIYIDATNGDDVGVGLVPFAPIKTIKRFNELLKSYRLMGMDTVSTGSAPRVNLRMVAGTYPGGLIDAPDLGCGRLEINSNGTPGVIFSSALIFTNIPSSVIIELKSPEFSAPGDIGFTFPYGNRKFKKSTSTTTTTTTSYISSTTVTNTTTLTYSFAGVSSPTDIGEKIHNLFKNSTNLPTSFSVAAIGPVSLDIDNPIFNETPNTDYSSSIIGIFGARISCAGTTHRGTYPLAALAHGSSIKFERGFRSNVSLTFELALAHSYRFLVTGDDNCTAHFEGLCDFGLATINYLVRMTNKGSVIIPWDREVGVDTATRETYGTLPLLGIVDQNFSSDGILLSDGGFKNSIIQETVFKFESNVTLSTRFYSGYHAVFLGVGVAGTIDIDPDLQSDLFQVNQVSYFTALDGATFTINKINANVDVYVNGVNLAHLAFVTSVGQTTVKMTHIDRDSIIVSVLEGSLV